MTDRYYREGYSEAITENYPILGLQDTILGQSLSFDVIGNEFIRVLHCGGNHWVTVSNIGCPVSTIKFPRTRNNKCVHC